MVVLKAQRLTEVMKHLLTETNQVPIAPSLAEPPILPSVDKWRFVDNKKLAIRKTYKFIDRERRNSFIGCVLDVEDESCHTLEMAVSEDAVTVTTGSSTHVSAIDKEIARELDAQFKEVSYTVQTA